MGFRYVESGPLVRSSYHAEKHLFEISINSFIYSTPLSRKRKISLTEEELSACFAAPGERLLWKRLYDMYSSFAVYGVISRIINETAVAEDVLQDTFVKIWNSFAKLQRRKRPFIYLDGKYCA